MAQFEFDQWLEFFLDNFQLIYEWDEGNKNKSYVKHRVELKEAEEAFLDEKKLILGKQISPKVDEERFGFYGITEKGKLLFINFTIRNLKIRVISFREANTKEILKYEKRKILR